MIFRTQKRSLFTVGRHVRAINGDIFWPCCSDIAVDIHCPVAGADFLVEMESRRAVEHAVGKARAFNVCFADFYKRI